MDRLDILLKGNVIDENMYKILRSIDNEILNYDKEKKWRFLTHASMALSRIKKKEEVESLDIFIINQLKNNDNFPEAELLLKKWFNEFPYEIPESEKWYIIMHILDYMEVEKWK